MNLFGITFIKMSLIDIATVNSKHNCKSSKFCIKYNTLPEFVMKFDKDKFVINRSDEFFQFVYDPKIIDASDNESYVLFDLTMSDSIITEEISNDGIEGFLEFIGFEDFYNKNYKNFLIHEYDQRYYLAREQFFVVKINSYYSNTDYGDEYDEVIDIVGYLDNEMNLQEGE